MASFKAQIRELEEKSDGKCNIKIRVSHNGKTRYISTEYDILTDYFDNVQGIVKQKHPNARALNRSLRYTMDTYEGFVADKLGTRVRQIDVNQLVRLIKDNKEIGEDFYKFTEKFIQELIDNGKQKTSEVYGYTLSFMKKYYPGELNFETINLKFLKELETFMYIKELKVNTISVHMRNIRAIFNRAIDYDVINMGLYPFRKYKIKSEETEKRNLSSRIIRIIRDKRLYDPNEIISRDIFMLTFYLIGINIKDLMYLRPSDFREGRIYYSRFKTKKRYSILVPPEAYPFIEKYRGEEYLFWFKEHYKLYESFRRKVNEYLQQSVQKKKFNCEITLYYARHSWATLAHKLKIPDDTIKLALGHGRKTVTDGYVERDLSQVDEANRIIIDSIL